MTRVGRVRGRYGRGRPKPVTVAAVVLTVVLATLLGSCGSAGTAAGLPEGTQATTPTTLTTTAATPAVTASASTTTGSSSTTTPASVAISDEDAEAVRDVAFGYWAAYNAYDTEAALSYLDDGYRATKEPAIRDEVRRIKAFGVQLGVTEKSAPVLLGPDQAEMYLSMKEPLGTRTIWMKFARRGDSWAIIYSEEAG